MINNLHDLFSGKGSERSLHKALRLHHEEDATLIKARDEIRGALKCGLPALIKEALPHLEKLVSPKFFTQGSYAYKTIIRHCHDGQQIDMDDGCYLPMTFAEEFSVGQASDIFFRAVEAVLEPLAEKNKWVLEKDRKTCVRLVIDTSKHIDIPLYAIPDKEYEKLVALVESRYLFKSEQSFADAGVTWEMLPKNKVMLAIRDEGWRSSDPRPVADWVKRQAKTKGEQWRMIIRYLKAWRDYQWVKGGPSSILLMAAVDRVFQLPQKRDDLALLNVLRGLPDVLAHEVQNPASEDYEDLALPLNQGDLRAEVLRKLHSFHADLFNAVYSLPPSEACTAIQSHLGSRFPMSPELIRSENPREEVKNAAARVSAAAPMIQTTRSG